MSNSEQQTCHQFTLDEIKTATRNFDEELIIGKGGFGLVYKGIINDGAEVVAIKRLSIASNQGETEFSSEIQTLSKLQHPHLVCLKGFCNESQEMILVYEYMSNGTLADHLYKIKDLGSASTSEDNQQFALTWEERLNICIGAARGLDFLHRVYEPGIIHRDIKDSNILLDANFVAKIADFGLAKLVKTSSESDTTIVSSTGVKGTFGYLDPEYFYTQRPSKKTDVYAFGVLLLVVLCGRPAVNNKSTEDQRSLAEWANKCIQKNRVDEIIDPHLAGKISSMSLKLFVKLSQKCLLRQSEKRPTMEEVVSGLELALKKQPEFYGTRSGQQNERSSLTQMVAKLQMVFMQNIYETRSRQPNGSSSLRQMVLTQKQSDKENFCKEISLQEIKAATRNFSEKLFIGEGGFGKVYVGCLNNGSEVAIKKIKTEGDTMFWREILTLSKVQHDHVVRLKGYCKNSSEMILVYEYMSKGSLEGHLFKHGDNQQACLTWEQRLNICIGSARGINFLHNGEPCIIHRNVKCSNILLDDKFVPKISSLKMSMLDNGGSMSTRVMGTVGYVDPEYYRTWRVTTKSDVYSFGVVLLVVLSGIKAWGRGNDVTGETPLPQWALKCIKEDMIDQIIDPHLKGQIKSESLEQFLKISLQCVRTKPKDRPTMEEVVSGLELAMEFQMNV